MLIDPAFEALVSQLNPAIEASMDPVCILDSRARIVYANKGMQVFLATTRRALVKGVKFCELIKLSVCAKECQIEAALKAGTEFHLSETPAARKGEKLRISIKMSGIVPNGNGSEGAVLSLRDTTAEILLHAKYHKSMSLLEESREKLTDTEDRLSALRRSLRHAVSR